VSHSPQAFTADSIRAVLEHVYAGPEYDWTVRRHPLQFVFDWYGDLRDWLAQLEIAHPVAYWVLIGVMTGVLAAVLVHFGYLIWRALRPRQREPAAMTPAISGRRDAAWHLVESRRLADSGQCSQALAHRFASLILDLDQRKILRFHPSKTPAEYVREARLDTHTAESLRELVALLYRHVFGGMPCTDHDVTAFDRRASALVGQ
jgi:hypothetical protein